MRKKILAVLMLFFLAIPVYCSTVSDLTTQIRQHIGDPSTTTTKQRWSDDEILVLINEAQKDIIDRTYCIIKSTTIDLTSDTTYYDLPTDFVKADKGVYKNETIPETTINYLDRENASWLSSSTGTPTNFFINKELTKVGLYPCPSNASAAYDLDIWYVAVTTMNASSDTPLENISRYKLYQKLIVYYVVGHIALEEGYNTATTWLSLYDRGLERMTENINVVPVDASQIYFQRQ